MVPKFCKEQGLLADIVVFCIFCTFLICMHGSGRTNQAMRRRPRISTTHGVAEFDQTYWKTGDGDDDHQLGRVRGSSQRKPLNYEEEAGGGDDDDLPQRAIRFMLVTGEQPMECRAAGGSYQLVKSYKNKVDYCNLHGCKVWYSLEAWEPDFRGTWARYPLLKRLMQIYPSIEWFMWMDSDAMFTDMSFSIPFHQYNSWWKNLVIPGYWGMVYQEDADWLSLNAGIFLIRNCEWSQRFLDKWMDFGRPEMVQESTIILNREFKNRPKHWPADDQSALVYLLRQNQTEYDQKAFLEASYNLHGFWDVIVDKYERMLIEGDGRESWSFVTHFCGCKLCTGAYATSQSGRCRSSFERAYNFADNQVLASVGMKHVNLNTSDVVSIAAIF